MIITSRKKLIYLVGAIVLSGAVLGYKYWAGGSERMFKYYVAKPVPASVQNIQQGGFRTMDSIFWVISFQVAKSDLDHLLQQQHFSLLKEDELMIWDQTRNDNVRIGKADYLNLLQDRIGRIAKLNTDLSGEWEIYKVNELHRERLLLYSNNHSQALFIVDFH